MSAALLAQSLRVQAAALRAQADAVEALAVAAEQQPAEVAPDGFVAVADSGLPERTVRRLLRDKMRRFGRADYVLRSDLLALDGDRPRPGPDADDGSVEAVGAAWRNSRGRAA